MDVYKIWTFYTENLATQAHVKLMSFTAQWKCRSAEAGGFHANEAGWDQPERREDHPLLVCVLLYVGTNCISFKCLFFVSEGPSFIVLFHNAVLIKPYCICVDDRNKCLIWFEPGAMTWGLGFVTCHWWCITFRLWSVTCDRWAVTWDLCPVTCELCPNWVLCLPGCGSAGRWRGSARCSMRRGLCPWNICLKGAVMHELFCIHILDLIP